MDKFTSQKRSDIMRSVHSKHTKLERKVMEALLERGLSFDTYVDYLPGKPDIAIVEKRKVVFIDSCFWHGCPLHLRMPKTNVEYWRKKIEKNRMRDEEVTQYYRQIGWDIMRIWEHDIKENFDEVIFKLIKFLRE